LKGNSLKPHIYSILAIIFFSTIEVVGKLIGAEISPYGITAWRFLIGGLLILPFALSEKSPSQIPLQIKDYLQFAMAGILVVCISMLFLQISILYGKAVLSAVIVSTNTLFVTLFAFLLFRERISKVHIIGIGLGLIGLFLIIYGERAQLASSRNLVLGVLFGIAASLTFALYTLYSKKLLLKFGNLTTLSFAFIFGAVILFVYSILTDKSVMFVPNLKNIALLLYLSVFVTGIAYILYFAAIKQIGAARASLYFFLKPAVASILAWGICKETIVLIQIAGILLIILSLSIDIFKKAIAISNVQPTGT